MIKQDSNEKIDKGTSPINKPQDVGVINDKESNINLNTALA